MARRLKAKADSQIPPGDRFSGSFSLPIRLKISWPQSLELWVVATKKGSGEVEKEICSEREQIKLMQSVKMSSQEIGTMPLL